ncbi:eukaryotic translation initiation factor 3 subunit B-like isoform X2 [Chenopodium quinoa]|uniref:eukaryotic translation initiation factor 3 subunit B-like isoform X2 n=1 Tax=Chenopodium quinoa TaxID=63459 RepID=UPI000B779103|nr:eukaryotic translation initiation factor 3 subunit B-like isoform X2 [Chenopodium quinoa]XP_021720772.1 eukaryotic translation initiation factor 3 subunit B-like isoform X2 [Chenopodium quinoa]
MAASKSRVPYGWPFQRNPEVYRRPSSITSTSKQRYFSILHNHSISIFTYDDDSDAFLPLYNRTFNLMKNIDGIRWSPFGSSLLCVKGNHLFVLLTQPSFQEFKFSVDGQLQVWEAKTGKIMKSFGNAVPQEFCSARPLDYIKWEYHDNYFAALVGSNRMVTIYETKTFSRVKHLMFKQVREFGWSPSASVLALSGDSYMKIVDICSGKKLYGHSWEGVDDYKLLWQSDGDYLACICTGFNYKKIFLISLKSGKAGFISPHHDYIDLAWECNGKQFAVSRGADNAGQTTVTFYTMNEDKNYLRQRTKSVSNMIAHFLYWSPNGNYMVMQGPLNGSGELYFYDVIKHQQLAFVHFIARNLQWDASGRFFLTRATRKNCDEVVRIWSSHGEKLIDVGPFDYHMCWSNKVSLVAESAKYDDYTNESSSIGICSGMVKVSLERDR